MYCGKRNVANDLRSTPPAFATRNSTQNDIQYASAISSFELHSNWSSNEYVTRMSCCLGKRDVFVIAFRNFSYIQGWKKCVINTFNC